MKFEDGDNVVYYNPGHKYHLMNFKCYKSQYTIDAFRLKYGEREVVADISELRPPEQVNELIQQQYTAPFSDDMYLQRAYGHGLNQIGQHFGVWRSSDIDGQDEPDDKYRLRIMDEMKTRTPYGNPRFQ